EQLDPTGLYYNRARYYNPNLGRFISRDMVMGQPLHPQSMNPYSYVQNNPALYTDPSGHLAFLPLLLIAVNAAFLVLDTQELIKTWSDPNSGLLDRGLAIGSVALDLVGIGAEVKGIVGAAKVGAKATEALGKILGVTTKAGETGKIGSEGSKVVTKVGGEAGKATHVEKTITGADKVGDTGRTVDSSSSAIGGCSFSSDTPVATDQGEKPIGSLQVGDKVLAFDETSGTTGNYVVQAVLINDDPEIEYLRIDGEWLETTPEHPFYTEEQGWIAAGDLWQGAHIRKADGSYGQVQTVEIVQKHKQMYNLTVEQAHTFFVGERQWLVHNTCATRTASTTDIFQDLDRWSLVQIDQRQKTMIKDKLSTIKQRSTKATEIVRQKGFTSSKELKLIENCEKETGVSWPIGSDVTTHHIIPLKNGGSNEWWNIAPVRYPHQGTIHGKGSSLRRELPYSLPSGTITELR
ncbi:MAG: polymorphic toxin-type HINT domain-containing protein, partial [Chloroflexota bacterium]